MARVRPARRAAPAANRYSCRDRLAGPDMDQLPVGSLLPPARRLPAVARQTTTTTAAAAAARKPPATPSHECSSTAMRLQPCGG
jgi:hypothetical protein